MPSGGRPPHLDTPLGDPVARAGVDHALHDDMRRGKPVLERYGDADELIPLLDDEGEIDRVAGQRSSGP
jgi:hypothetical protein